VTAVPGHARAGGRRRPALGWLARAAIDGAAAGAAVGLIEVVRLAMVGGAQGLPALLLVAAGLCALGGLAVGVPLSLAAWLVGRQPWARRVRSDLVEPGERRVSALVRAAVAVAATCSFAAVVSLLAT